MTKIAFEALIKKYEPMTLASGDKQVSVTLQLNDDAINEATLNALNALYMKTPELVMVVLMDKEEFVKTTKK